MGISMALWICRLFGWWYLVRPAPIFSGFFDRPRQPENTSSRDGLSVICQSESAT